MGPRHPSLLHRHVYGACLLPSLRSPHQERCEAMEDVGQRQEDSGLALQLPLGALLVHQPPFLCWGGERPVKARGRQKAPGSPSPAPGSPRHPAPPRAPPGSSPATSVPAPGRHAADPAGAGSPPPGRCRRVKPAPRELWLRHRCPFPPRPLRRGPGSRAGLCGHMACFASHSPTPSVR